MHVQQSSWNMHIHIVEQHYQLRISRSPHLGNTKVSTHYIALPIAPPPCPRQGLQIRLHLNRTIQHSSFSLIYLTLCNVDFSSVSYHVPAFSSPLKTVSLLYPSVDGFLGFLSCFVNSDGAVCISKQKPQVPAFNSWVYTQKQNG